jgi:hypothetical protein
MKRVIGSQEGPPATRQKVGSPPSSLRDPGPVAPRRSRGESDQDYQKRFNAWSNLKAEWDRLNQGSDTGSISSNGSVGSQIVDETLRQSNVQQARAVVSAVGAETAQTLGGTMQRMVAAAGGGAAGGGRSPALLQGVKAFHTALDTGIRDRVVPLQKAADKTVFEIAAIDEGPAQTKQSADIQQKRQELLARHKGQILELDAAVKKVMIEVYPIISPQLVEVKANPKVYDILRLRMSTLIKKYGNILGGFLIAGTVTTTTLTNLTLFDIISPAFAATTTVLTSKYTGYSALAGLAITSSAVIIRALMCFFSEQPINYINDLTAINTALAQATGETEMNLVSLQGNLISQPFDPSAYAATLFSSGTKKLINFITNQTDSLLQTALRLVASMPSRFGRFITALPFPFGAGDQLSVDSFYSEASNGSKLIPLIRLGSGGRQVSSSLPPAAAPSSFFSFFQSSAQTPDSIVTRGRSNSDVSSLGNSQPLSQSQGDMGDVLMDEGVKTVEIQPIAAGGGAVGSASSIVYEELSESEEPGVAEEVEELNAGLVDALDDDAATTPTAQLKAMTGVLGSPAAASPAPVGPAGTASVNPASPAANPAASPAANPAANPAGPTFMGLPSGWLGRGGKKTRKHPKKSKAKKSKANKNTKKSRRTVKKRKH